jgi:urease gamma subunit
VVSLDWTLAHHERGPEIFGVNKAWDYIEHRVGRFQTVMTAVVANRALIDGIAIEVQRPDYREEELGYLEATRVDSFEAMEAARRRLIELMHVHKNRLAYRKRTEVVLDMVKVLEEEGLFPSANYAFDNGVLTLDLTRHIEECGKHSRQRDRNLAPHQLAGPVAAGR